MVTTGAVIQGAGMAPPSLMTTPRPSAAGPGTGTPQTYAGGVTVSARTGGRPNRDTVGAPVRLAGGSLVGHIPPANHHGGNRKSEQFTQGPPQASGHPLV